MTVKRYDYDVPASEFGDRREIGETVYFGSTKGDGSCPGCHYKDVSYSNALPTDWETLGRHYKTTIVSDDSGLSKTGTTIWAPIFTPSDPTKPWFPNLYTSQSVAVGAQTLTQKASFRSDGFLLSTTTNDSSYGSIGHGYGDDGHGNAGTETQVAATGADGTGAVIGNSYSRTRTFTNGVLLTSKWTSLGWLDTTRSIDPVTGLVLRTTDPDTSSTVAYTYDSLGRVLSVTPAFDAPTTVVYDSPTKTTIQRSGSDQNGTLQRVIYDSLGRVSREIRQMPTSASVRIHRYDAMGRKTFVSEWLYCVNVAACETVTPSGLSSGTTWASFDPLGRSTTITKADLSVNTLSYADTDKGVADSDTMKSSSVNVCTQISQTQPCPSQTAAKTVYRLDILGRILSVTEPPDPTGPRTTYTYDAGDRLLTVAQGTQVAPGITTSRKFDYDAFGFLRSEVTPEKGHVIYGSYDALGNVLQSSDDRLLPPDSRRMTLTRTYDAAGRLTLLTSNENPSQTYANNTYDAVSAANGRLSRSTSANPTFSQGNFSVTEDLSYNPAGRLSQRLTTVPGLAGKLETDWTYNSLGLVSSIQHSSGGTVTGSLVYSYSNGYAQSMQGLTSGQGSIPVLASASYNDAGGISAYTLGNGLTTSITTDGVLPRPHQISAGTAWSSGTYSYDGAGNITGIGNDRYSYDVMSRLTGATLAGVSNTFSYDQWGNLLTKGPGVPQAFTIDSNRNQIAASASVAYDAAGNLTNYPSGQVFRYDGVSRETDFSGPSVQESYIYDASGERVGRAATAPPLLPIFVSGDTEWSICSAPNHVVSFQATLTASAGASPFTWQLLSSPSYPSWITLTSGGILAAIVPMNETSIWPLSVRVTDASGRTGTATLKLIISNVCLHWLYEPQDEILCTGESFSAAALADAGGAAISYQWQQGDAAGNFTDIPGKTGASMTITPTTGVSYYRVRAFLSTGAEIISQVATAWFNQPIRQHLLLYGGNTVSYCQGAPGLPLSQFLYAVGGDLQIVWQQQLTDGTWQNIQGNTASPTQSTNYRAKLTAFCPPQTVYSDSILVTITLPPTITSAPPSQTYCAGSAVTLNASSNVAAFFKWQRFDVPTSTWVTLQDGANQTLTSSLTLSPSATTSYRVLATNYCAVAETDFTLTQQTLPTVTGLPANVSICPPQGVALTATVTNAVSQKWQVSTDNVNWNDVPGATGSSYQTPVFTIPGGYFYRLLATNSCGTTTGSTAIQVKLSPPASITGSACSVSSGQPSTLTCYTDGSLSPTYHWSPGNQTTQSIVVSPTTTTTYTCTVTAYTGCATSASYTVTVGAATSAPNITAPPQNVSVCSGLGATLGVTATGTNLFYQWQKPGMAAGLWHMDENVGTFAADSSGAGYTGIATGTTIAMGRWTNARSFSAASDKVSVSNAPNLAISGALTLEAWVLPTSMATWNLVLAKQRAVEPTNYPGNYELMIQSNGILWFGHTDPTNTLRFYVSTGTVPLARWSHVAVTWQPGTPGQVQFYINGQPAGTSADASEGSALTSADPLTIGWRADSVHFIGQIDEVAVWRYARTANEIAAAYGAPPDGWGGLPGANASTYGAPNANATYRVQVGNTCGVVSSAAATVTVSSNIPASIVTQPTSGNYCQGGSKTLTVVGAGTAISYRWETYDTTFSAWRFINSAQSVAVSPPSSAQYRVTVSNSCNAIVSNVVTVTMDPPVSINTQPAGGTMCPGGRLLFVNTSADYEADVHYQWRLGGVNLPAPSDWTYFATAGGTYDVVITNACGSVTSSPATMRVVSCGAALAPNGKSAASFHGAYDPATGKVTLDQGGADTRSARTVAVGERGLAIVGDWDGDGVSSLGFYDRSRGVFELWNGDPQGAPDHEFAFGPRGAEWQPVAGDWDGDGIDTVGLVNVLTGDILLRNENAAGAPDRAYKVRIGFRSGTAVVGDWTSKGYDSVGMYDPESTTFFLWDGHKGGAPDHAIAVEAKSRASKPVAGDWSGNRLTSVGLFDPESGEIRLWYGLRPGAPDLTTSFAAGSSAGTQVFAGRWNAIRHAPGGHGGIGTRLTGISAALATDPESSLESFAGPNPDRARAGILRRDDGPEFLGGFTLASNRMGASSPRSGGIGAKSPQVAGLANGQTWFYTIRDEGNRPSIQYHLDPSGNLVLDRLNVYLGNQLIASYEAYQTTPEWTYYSSDHLGSPRLITGSGANTIATPRYAPYGEALSGAGANSAQFAAMERDAASGMDYDHARFNGSLLGRFLSPDRVGGRYSDPQSWNRYSYGGNNPIRYLDADGKLKRDAMGQLIFKPAGSPMLVGHEGKPGVLEKVQPGVLYTDRGDAVTAYRNSGNDTCFNADCHGLTFADGRYWIENNQADKILKGDNYARTDAPQVGDVAVYRDSDGNAVHSTTVTQVGDDGSVTSVAGVGGIQPSSQEASPTPGPGGAWSDPNASVEYYHRSSDTRSPEQRAKDADYICQYAKPSCTIN